MKQIKWSRERYHAKQRKLRKTKYISSSLFAVIIIIAGVALICGMKASNHIPTGHNHTHTHVIIHHKKFTYPKHHINIQSSNKTDNSSNYARSNNAGLQNIPSSNTNNSLKSSSNSTNNGNTSSHNNSSTATPNVKNNQSTNNSKLQTHQSNTNKMITKSSAQKTIPVHMQKVQ